MKRAIFAAIGIAVLTASTGYAQAPKPAAKAFDQIKALAGEWVAKMSDGGETRVAYRVASAGSAVIETIGDDASGMVSVYTLDGDRILMTHYCSAGNQPRMAAKVAPDAKTLVFEFVDISNLLSPDGMHIRGLAMTIGGPDQVTNVWTHRMGGKDGDMKFELLRKK
ncbi:MAG: hypothetical protein IPF82_14380 [Blastocatellia bacterium]|nr:hypothetical protein [Blastocatellia bacterium]